MSQVSCTPIKPAQYVILFFINFFFFVCLFS
uniref:Uncharacterized protein n=1 Tax=Anguilla anguilla TaxID=7936 RepID=A0A0E9P731_ANGAN